MNERNESGYFLVCSDEIWRKLINPNEVKKKVKKYTNTNTIEENYYLLYILKKLGWRIIFDNLIFKNSANKSEIQGRKVLTGFSSVDHLGNLLNMNSILVYYKSQSE